MPSLKKGITRKRDFDLIFKEGKGFKNGFFLFKFIFNDLRYNRFAFVVSQKVSKKAVERNRIRRVLKEMFKKNFNSLERNIDGVLIVFPGFKHEEWGEAKENLIEIFKKAKLIK